MLDPVYIGVDPSLRHTGLCLIRGAEDPVFSQIDTKKLDLTSSIQQIQMDLTFFLDEELGYPTKEQQIYWCIEKQIPVGASMSSMMYTIQAVILSTIYDWYRNNWPKKYLDAGIEGRDLKFIMPAPSQLRKYLRDVHEAPVKKAKDTKAFFIEQTGYKGVISEHKIDAYYMAKLGQDVIAGNFSYPMNVGKKKTTPLLPWAILNGSD